MIAEMASTSSCGLGSASKSSSKISFGKEKNLPERVTMETVPPMWLIGSTRFTPLNLYAGLLMVFSCWKIRSGRLIFEGATCLAPVL